MSRKKKTLLDKLVEEDKLKKPQNYGLKSAPVGKRRNAIVEHLKEYWWVYTVLGLIAGILIYVFWEQVVGFVGAVGAALFFLYVMATGNKSTGKRKSRRR